MTLNELAGLSVRESNDVPMDLATVEPRVLGLMLIACGQEDRGDLLNDSQTELLAELERRCQKPTASPPPAANPPGSIRDFAEAIRRQLAADPAPPADGEQAWERIAAAFYEALSIAQRPSKDLEDRCRGTQAMKAELSKILLETRPSPEAVEAAKQSKNVGAQWVGGGLYGLPENTIEQLRLCAADILRRAT